MTALILKLCLLVGTNTVFVDEVFPEQGVARIELPVKADIAGMFGDTVFDVPLTALPKGVKEGQRVHLRCPSEACGKAVQK